MFGVSVSTSVVHEARLVPSERQDVPSERDGKILAVATLKKAGEVIPEGKAVNLEFRALVVRIAPGERVGEGEVISWERARYRRVRRTDELAPGTTKVVPVTSATIANSR